jgi:hypothetical protein
MGAHNEVGPFGGGADKDWPEALAVLARRRQVARG